MLSVVHARAHNKRRRYVWGLGVVTKKAEFMEHHDKALPIDIRTLGDLAERVHAYAKALHYKETEFNTSPSATLEALISINNKLQQPDAARGILQFAQRQHRVTLQASWYEKLQRWEDALESYERKQLVEPDSVECALGRMRCLRSLGEWERLNNLSADFWNRAEGVSLFILSVFFVLFCICLFLFFLIFFSFTF